MKGLNTQPPLTTPFVQTNVAETRVPKVMTTRKLEFITIVRNVKKK